jgi:hypothetical protein
VAAADGDADGVGCVPAADGFNAAAVCVAATRVAVAVAQAGGTVGPPLLARLPGAPPATFVPPGALAPAVGVASPLVVFGFVTVLCVPVPVAPGDPAIAVSAPDAAVTEPAALVLAPALAEPAETVARAAVPAFATLAPVGADVGVALLPPHAATSAAATSVNTRSSGLEKRNVTVILAYTPCHRSGNMPVPFFDLWRGTCCGWSSAITPIAFHELLPHPRKNCAWRMPPWRAGWLLAYSTSVHLMMGCNGK